MTWISFFYHIHIYTYRCLSYKLKSACLWIIMRCYWPWGNPPEPVGPSPGSQWSTTRPGTGRCGNRSAWGPSCPEGWSYRPPPYPALAAPGRKYKLHAWILKTGERTLDRLRSCFVTRSQEGRNSRMSQITLVYMWRIPFDPGYFKCTHTH